MRKMKLKITHYFTQIHEIVADLMGLVFSEGSFESQNLIHHFICLFMKIWNFFSYLYSQQCKWHMFDGVDVNKSMPLFFTKTGPIQLPAIDYWAKTISYLMYRSLVSIVSQIPNLHLLQTKVMGEDISACNLFPV